MSNTEEVFKSPSLPPPVIQSTSSETESDGKKNLVLWVDSPIESIDEVEPKEEDSAASAKISIEAPELHYKPPPWACQPEEGLSYQLEIVKEGKIIGHLNMDKRKNPTFIVIGRLPICDLVLAHPSISRYHCIMQYGEDTMAKTGKGWFLYDMGSTHGSKVNKRRLPSKQYIRAHVGHVLQFGGSSRVFNLVGPSSDVEPEWDCSPTEMKLKVHKKALEAKLAAAARKEIEEEERKEKEEEGCSWGMDYGDEERGSAPQMEMDPHLMEDREAYYVQDPRKALAKFFEREGFEMNFEFSEQGMGHTHKWVCTIELPVEIDGVDRAFSASATVSTSKKDAQTQCALDACRILDTYGVLRRANTKLRMKKKTLEDNDYYDEDDDLYLDRTGQIEKQREKRKQWAEEGHGSKKVEKDTYESLCAKLENAKAEIAETQAHLDALHSNKAEVKTGGDALDDYIRQLEKGAGTGDDLKTKTEKSMLRQKLVAATHEMQKLEKLVKIAKPIALPALKSLSATSGDKQAFLRRMMAASKQKKQEESVKPVETTPASTSTSTPTSSEDFTPEVDEEETEKSVTKPAEQSKEEPKSVAKEASPKRTLSTKVEEPKKEPEPVEQEAVEESPKTLKRRVDEWEEELAAEAQTKKKTRIRKRDDRKLDSADYGAGCEEREEKYTTWMPPDNQSGDGTSALHAKFGGRY